MDRICKVSNPELVLKQLNKYYGDKVDLYSSTSKNKKYMVYNEDGKKVHFGSIIHEDYTKHKNTKRILNYLKRASNIKGNWRQSPFSPNMLSIILLWDGYDYLEQMKN